MPTVHATITDSAEIHEAKQIVSGTTADAGKVITNDSVTNAVGEYRKLASTELSDTAAIALLTSTQTLTNKRVTPRISNVVYAASIGVNSDSFDILACDSMTGNITINAPTGTPTDGQRLIVRLTQDVTGTRVVTWNAAFVAKLASDTAGDAVTTWTYYWHAATSLWVDGS